MRSLSDHTRQEMIQMLESRGLPGFRGKQIFAWIQKGASSFDEMTDLPKDLRQALAEEFTLTGLTPLTVQTAKDGTRKYLFAVAGGEAIETVFMRYHYGNSVCVSSQAGCRMGCAFCASTRKGLSRDLTAGEMAEQVLFSERESGEPVNHVVVMGIGEPFDNYDNLCRFLTILHDPMGKGMSFRNITVSTCGLVPELERFGDEYPQVNLAVSLHAPTDELRRTIMPIANRYPLKDLMKAVKAHVDKTGRRITFEYALMEGINDTEEAVSDLVKLLAGLNCHVNLIPLNRVDESGFVGTRRERVREICDTLQRRGIQATVRRSLGRDIDAACGQLRLQNV